MGQLTTIKTIIQQMEYMAHAQKQEGSNRLLEKKDILTISKTISASHSEGCPYGKCDGNGIICVQDEEGRWFARYCDCMDQKVVESKIKFAEIPQEFRNLTIQSFETKRYQTTEGRKRAILAKRAAANFVKHYKEIKQVGKGLYFYGYEKGSGKTRLAVSIGNALMQVHKVSVKFVSTIQLLDEIKATFGGDSCYTQSQLLQTIKQIEVLILDDMGTERPTVWVNEIFYGILNERMTQKKVTIFTANCSMEKLKHDERIKNRMEKMAVPVWFPEESVRRYLAKDENEKMQRVLFAVG